MYLIADSYFAFKVFRIQNLVCFGNAYGSYGHEVRTRHWQLEDGKITLQLWNIGIVAFKLSQGLSHFRCDSFLHPIPQLP